METEEQMLQAAQKVHEEHHKSVVLVLRYSDAGLGMGSGFIIKSTEKYAFVMTCNHVVEQGNRIAIRLSGSIKELDAVVHHHDREADLAILLVSMSSKYPELMFREESKDVAPGKLVFLAAYYNPDVLGALCLDSDIYPGQISRPLFESPGSNLKQVVHSCRSKGGCSGGPIIYDGKVIGVQFETRKQIECAVSSESVNIVMQKWLGHQHEQVITIEEMINLLASRVSIGCKSTKAVIGYVIS